MLGYIGRMVVITTVGVIVLRALNGTLNNSPCVCCGRSS
jgi:hypothetical protein